MDIYISSEIGVCQEYMEAKGKKKETISVVISPLKVQTEAEGLNLRVINGCNMWQGCSNDKCFFSTAARTNPKIKANT